MSGVMPASGLEQMLTDLADRLGRQEDHTRRLEATLFALARLPADAVVTEDTVANSGAITPVPRTSSATLRNPARKPAAEPARAADDDRSTDGDILWAVAGLVTDPLVGLDADGFVRVWNPAAEDLFGWSAEETIGKPPPFLPDDKSLEHERLTADARFGKPAHDLHTVRRRRDGRLVRVSVAAAGAGGGVAFTIRPVGIPGRPVEVANEAPPPPPPLTIPDDVHLHGLAAVGRQVAAIAHDFNNLLTIIGGGVERLIEQFEGDDTRRDVAELVGAAARQAGEITRNLLDLACLGPDEAAPRVERCDLAAVVSAHAPVLQGLLGPDRALVLGLPDRPAEVVADPVRIGQVLLNLATNSRDAMPDGGTLAVEVETVADPESALGLAGPVAVLTVSDTGVGMDAETLSHAFEPFFTTKGHGLGCGLGLATVADIVREMGGTVVPESSPGTGTTIRVVVPLVSPSGPVLHRSDG
jgi:two-component system cell cycle sensor histidine kinase/response regulator CckA